MLSNSELDTETNFVSMMPLIPNSRAGETDQSMLLEVRSVAFSGVVVGGVDWQGA